MSIKLESTHGSERQTRVIRNYGRLRQLQVFAANRKKLPAIRNCGAI
jgi:hypothetical protein